MTTTGTDLDSTDRADQTPSTGLDILPSTTAVFSYRKLSANEQFFVGTQTVVSLL